MVVTETHNDNNSVEIQSLQQLLDRNSWLFDLLFDATTRKLLTSTVSRGLRLGNVLLTNADEGIQSTHLIKIEVYNLQKLNKIHQNEH
ncbi:Uncharacterized protein OBRU01_22680 [Operophtera brumata]|uniref:Uncharacterized protein n=1 Tax=Operophtera brumata TaxID=104452 RepID=A0A0L7KNT9_OPEBR|nr:Uncharacterized protein OBRU01_22680 [Operophtera brumata]